jgi:hypothetical protein
MGMEGSQLNFAADFEVDYMFAVNPGFGSASVFFDGIAKTGGMDIADYHGFTDQRESRITDNNAIWNKWSATFSFQQWRRNESRLGNGL